MPRMDGESGLVDELATRKVRSGRMPKSLVCACKVWLAAVSGSLRKVWRRCKPKSWWKLSGGGPSASARPDNRKVNNMPRLMIRQPAESSIPPSTAEERLGRQWRVVAPDGSGSILDPVPPQPPLARTNASMPEIAQILQAAGRPGTLAADGTTGGTCQCGTPTGAAVAAEANGAASARLVGGAAVAPARCCETRPSILLKTTAPGREIDAHLTKVINLWPDLPSPVRAAVLALVDAAARESR